MSEQMTHQAETFEDLIQQLDDAVNRLESPDLSLEDAIACYENAVDLALRCTKLLDDAELRVREIDSRLASVDAKLHEIEDEDEEIPFD